MITNILRQIILNYLLWIPFITLNLLAQGKLDQKEMAHLVDPGFQKHDSFPHLSKLLQIIPPEMVTVRGGTFNMGCTPEQNQALIALGYSNGCQTTTPINFSDANPGHEVTLPNFMIGKYEITQLEWFSLMGSNPSDFTSCGSDCPVESVSWYGAIVFCNRLSEQEGYNFCYFTDVGLTQPVGKNGNTWSIPSTGPVFWKPNGQGYRLPSEAEWEYAARGGLYSNGYWYAGSNNIGLVSWYSGNSFVPYTPNISGHGISPVGQNIPNELSLFDMSGNVFEWCFDWFQNGYNGLVACAPIGAIAGTNRVMRGGSWGAMPDFSLVSVRNYSPPNSTGNNVGFRVARTP